MNNYNTVYVGMDVHKESFSLCCFTLDMEQPKYVQKISSDYRMILKYLDKMRTIFGEDSHFVCGYEAGCLGYTLYHQLNDCGVECVILAPTTMLVETRRKRVKTDSRDTMQIAKCLAYHTYSPVHIPTEKDNQVKEYIRMRDDHKLSLKRIKLQILSFCLRHGWNYTGGGNWTEAHLNWLRQLELEEIYRETLTEYIITYEQLTSKIKRYDERIEELSGENEYKEGVKKLSCFMGIKTHSALSIMVEVGDFKRFSNAQKFASYIGLTPGEDSSGDDITHLGITKAGNSHVRRLLIEASQCYSRGAIGRKSKTMEQRQRGNAPEVIAYADRANERLRRKYYKMVLKNSKKVNVAKAAIARELACFIWGMMTENIS